MSKYLEKDEVKNDVIRIKKFPSRKVYSFEPHDIWSVDLTFFRKNKDVKGTIGRGGEKGALIPILNAVDIFSRKLYSQVLPDKQGENIVKGFEKIFKKHNVKPKNIVSDNEFLRGKVKKFFDLNKINAYTTNAFFLHNPIVERLNRTQRLTITQMAHTKSIAENIHKFQDKYNDAKHTTTKDTPNELTSNSLKINRRRNSETLNYFISKVFRKDKEKFNIGDMVYYVINRRYGDMEGDVKHESTRHMKETEKYELSHSKYKILDIKHTDKIQYKLSNLKWYYAEYLRR